jgi:hypothetical protein
VTEVALGRLACEGLLALPREDPESVGQHLQALRADE